jgi:putative transposase
VQQAERLTAWAHTCRWLWNVALEQRQIVWQTWHRPMRSNEQSSHVTFARAELDWVADLPAQSAQQVLRHLDDAYDNWWNPQHTAGPPRYKKRGARMSVPFPRQAVRARTINRRWAEVRLPKIGWVRLRFSRPLGGVLRNATVTLDALGWHLAVGVAVSQAPATPNGKPGCGVDFGVECSAFISDENEPRLMPPSLTRGEQRRLRSLEQRKARQITWAKRHNGGCYSNRLRRTINEISKLRARQARRRDDFTNKLTTDLAKRHGFVAIEDLRVKGMTGSARGNAERPGTNVTAKAGLNREILDNTWGMRRRQLAYKCPMFGSELVIVPAYGTSQTCAECGRRDPANRPGCGRTFACQHCGHLDHADRNAALVIETRAAGRAVNSTRSRLHDGEASSRMREPLVGASK